jgi:hypothetical protein
MHGIFVTLLPRMEEDHQPFCATRCTVPDEQVEEQCLLHCVPHHTDGHSYPPAPWPWHPNLGTAASCSASGDARQGGCKEYAKIPEFRPGALRTCRTPPGAASSAGAAPTPLRTVRSGKRSWSSTGQSQRTGTRLRGCNADGRSSSSTCRMKSYAG